MNNIRISGVGCCLVDRLYNHVPFSSEIFSAYSSKKRGDGGLTPGHLVLKEDFEKYAGKAFQLLLNELTQGRGPDEINIGGPCIVALIQVAQMTVGLNCDIQFYGSYGADEEGKFLKTSLRKFPIGTSNYIPIGNLTPSTDVFSDPDYDDGHGERVFVNSIASSRHYLPENLNSDFFGSDIVVFGGTALVPPIHQHLAELLKKCKENGAMTVVNTVFDFINEKADPHKRWPLGESDESYRYIDLLIVDKDEALRLSGEKTLEQAMQFFIEQHTGAVIITNGVKNVLIYAGNALFGEVAIGELPISNALSELIKEQRYRGDTTGCGDNFAGGVIASLAFQLHEGRAILNLREAAALGVVSGGYACLYIGGTYFEKSPGEKYGRIIPFLKDYKEQIK